MTAPVRRLAWFLGFVPVSRHNDSVRPVSRQPASHVAVIHLSFPLSLLCVRVAVKRFQVRGENIDPGAVDVNASPGKAAQSSEGAARVGVSGRARKWIA